MLQPWFFIPASHVPTQTDFKTRLTEFQQDRVSASDVSLCLSFLLGRSVYLAGVCQPGKRQGSLAPDGRLLVPQPSQHGCQQAVC